MTVLLAPLLAGGRGTGHVRRCLDLAERLGDRAAFVTGLDAEEPLAGMLGSWPRVAAGSRVNGGALVVADRFRTGRDAYLRLAAMGPVVGIDEGGPARRWMSLLIDTPLRGGAAAASALLELPPRRRPVPPARFERVLVSFGGEDPAGITGPLVRLLLSRRMFAPGQITIVQGPRFAETRWPDGVAVLVSPERLRDRLHEYDLVLTAFGLTGFEALAAGVPVILVSPSRLHRRLARRAGFAEVGLRRARPAALARALADPAALGRQVEALHARPRGSSLAETIGGLRLSTAACPACGGSRGPDRVVARFGGRTYLRCRGCGLIYMVRLAGAPMQYDHGYFFESYARQYGRTYLEDYDSILRASQARVGAIEGIVGPLAGLRVLDVGCAYGPFLDASLRRGAEPQGVEVASEAVAHVRDKLGVPCWEGRFEDFDGRRGGYEVLSMWYVIEHFAALEPVLRRVNGLLAGGGLFAFSTPNAFGVSGRGRRLPRFLEASPSDHFTIWDPRRARRVLSRFGFRLARVRVTGHHPERFPGAARLAPGSAGFRVLDAWSRIRGLGDTFEAYAVKVRDLDEA